MLLFFTLKPFNNNFLSPYPGLANSSAIFSLIMSISDSFLKNFHFIIYIYLGSQANSTIITHEFKNVELLQQEIDFLKAYKDILYTSFKMEFHQQVFQI